MFNAIDSLRWFAHWFLAGLQLLIVKEFRHFAALFDGFHAIGRHTLFGSIKRSAVHLERGARYRGGEEDWILIYVQVRAIVLSSWGEETFQPAKDARDNTWKTETSSLFITQVTTMSDSSNVLRLILTKNFFYARERESKFLCEFAQFILVIQLTLDTWVLCCCAIVRRWCEDENWKTFFSLLVCCV